MKLGIIDWAHIRELDLKSKADDRYLDFFADVEVAQKKALALGFLVVSIGEMRERQKRLERSVAAFERARKNADAARLEFDEAIVITEGAARMAGASE